MSDTLQFVVVTRDGLAGMLGASFASQRQTEESSDQVPTMRCYFSTIRGSEWPVLNVGTSACYTNSAAVTPGHSLSRTVLNPSCYW